LREWIQKREVKVVIFADGFDAVRTRELARLCLTMGALPRHLSNLHDRLSAKPGQKSTAALREIAVEDLLGREPVKLDVGQVENMVKGRVLLVTGAAGSIGSELCRQALRFQPQSLLLFDTNENGLFFLERELREAFPKAELFPLVGDIGDERRVEDVFRRFHPEVVLHAAAHKHVPMMEANACQAVKNNVFGTQVVADAADRYDAKAFVLVSTDKAVRPTSVMGATKRGAEMVVQKQAHGSKTRFVAVRFGNVLGSAGSVVPIFKEQIAKGQPLTITHPEMTRFFMTIPEAAQLVLQAGALGSTGDVYLLDMGKAVKIIDLARDIIELSGLRPGVDVEIKFTGLRPGEKLHEELLLEDEAFDHTPHPKIKVGRIQLPPRVVLIAALRKLEMAVAFGNEPLARKALSELVTEAKLKLLPETMPERMLGQVKLKAV
jgi:FlaA1/EpsC-like NDP-sugar epimerase